jgi:PhnB protein
MLIPYLIVSDGKSALEFYREVLGAQVTFEPVYDDKGRVGHSELQLPCGAKIMLADEHPELSITGPSSESGAGPMLVLQTPDLEAIAERMQKAGAQTVKSVGDDGHGGRAGRFSDPFGYVWIISNGS